MSLTPRDFWTADLKDLVKGLRVSEGDREGPSTVPMEPSPAPKHPLSELRDIAFDLCAQAEALHVHARGWTGPEAAHLCAQTIKEMEVALASASVALHKLQRRHDETIQKAKRSVFTRGQP